MKVVIFAGGKGTRISEETIIKPKPMVTIGEKPILWHIMKMYSSYGFKDFVVCLGYKGYAIKEYFVNYFFHNSDISVNLANNNIKVHNSWSEDFNISLVDTGLDTMTAGRLKKVRDFVDGERFMLTYGDGVSDVNLKELLKFHDEQGKTATVTAVQAPGRFGMLDIQDSGVQRFVEKPKGDGGWINGGFFVLEPNVFDFIPESAEDIMWEQDPLISLAKAGELSAYRHLGFWKPMDTVRDRDELEKLWNSTPPWKIWN
ncbi:MAG: glucose-1-phosphate cytidylyltransferase [Cytophagia bacterium]|nr:glucose-1-phosphate cytidylyltransferase [Cytophagia bacterium]